MEEVLSMIFYGSELVKELESSLPEKAPESLLTSLDEIAKTFGSANERLKMLLETRNSETTLSQMLMQIEIEPSLMQENWLRYGGPTSSQRTEAIIQTQLMAVDGGIGRNLTDVEGSGGATGSSTPRQRRRKGEGEEKIVLVAAVRTGNTDMPPDDGHTWRKYGQKEILDSRFPRAYYRCTHQKLYNCPAKKQVQRLNDDPSTFRVAYRGSHTCQIYSIAPTASSVAPTAPFSSFTTSHSADYGLADMADAMLGGGGVGTNMDFIFPDPISQHHQRSPRLDDGDENKNDLSSEKNDFN